MKAQPCLPKAPAGKEARGWLIRDRRGPEERPIDEPSPDNEALSGHAGWQPLDCTGQITKRRAPAQPATPSRAMSGCCCPLHCFPASPFPAMASGGCQSLAPALGHTLQPPLHDAQTAFLPADSPPHGGSGILLLQRALIPLIFKERRVPLNTIKHLLADG